MRGKGAPTKRERELADAIALAADALERAEDFAQTYVARVELLNAWRAYDQWTRAGRPARTRAPA